LPSRRQRHCNCNSNSNSNGNNGNGKTKGVCVLTLQLVVSVGQLREERCGLQTELRIANFSAGAAATKRQNGKQTPN